MLSMAKGTMIIRLCCSFSAPGNSKPEEAGLRDRYDRQGLKDEVGCCIADAATHFISWKTTGAPLGGKGYFRRRLFARLPLPQHAL